MRSRTDRPHADLSNRGRSLSGGGRQVPRGLVIRVLGVGTVLGLCLLWLQHALLAPLLPILEAMVELIRPELEVQLAWVNMPSGSVLSMDVMALHDIAFDQRRGISRGARLGTFTTTAYHTLVPLLLFFTALLSWPARSGRAWLSRLLGALAVLPVLIAAGAPLVLMGQVDIACVRQAHRMGVALETPALVDIMIFMEMGGCWLLPLVSAVICIGASGRIAADPPHGRFTLPAPDIEALPVPSAVAFPPVAIPRTGGSSAPGP